jgi:hypothetical protein
VDGSGEKQACNCCGCEASHRVVRNRLPRSRHRLHEEHPNQISSSCPWQVNLVDTNFRVGGASLYSPIQSR